jgi:hypothetical protein
MSNLNNTGDCNTGNRNTGDCNTGNRNTGDRNTGYYNTGYCNTGNRNTGDCNTGYYNTGYCNTGDCNTGNRNTGDYNTGDYNTGDYNTGDYNTGYCNTITPKIRLFNNDSDIDFGTDAEYKIYNTIAKYQKQLCEWVSASNMTDEEKKENTKWETTQGYLKVNDLTFNGNEITKEDEKYFRDLPNFNEEIFKTCTGIDLSNKTVIITVDGKNISISKEEFENIKAQFLGKGL